MGFIGVMGAGELSLIITVAIIIFVIPLIALIDILRSDFEGNNKLIWVLVVLFLWIIGAVIYFIMGRNQKVSD
jgi:hypothetical protein